MHGIVRLFHFYMRKSNAGGMPWTLERIFDTGVSSWNLETSPALRRVAAALPLDCDTCGDTSVAGRGRGVNLLNDLVPGGVMASRPKPVKPQKPKSAAAGET